MKTNLGFRFSLLVWSLFLSQLNSQDVSCQNQSLSSTRGSSYSAGQVPPIERRNLSNDGRTLIESAEGAIFDNASNSAEFSGNVIVCDPHFDLRCDKLQVIMRPDRRGIQLVVARANVVISQERQNNHGNVVKSVGKCGKITYDPISGDVTMEEWPEVQQGINHQFATQKTTIIILNAKGSARTIGASRTLVVDQENNPTNS